MYIRDIPAVMKHVAKCLEHSNFLMEHEVIKSHGMTCLLPLSLRETIRQSYVFWDHDDDSSSDEYFVAITCCCPYNADWIHDEGYVRRVEVHRTGKVIIETRDGDITVDNIMTDAWTSEGLFQLGTVHDLGEIQLHEWHDIWFSYLDIHREIWGEYVHNQDYLRNR